MSSFAVRLFGTLSVESEDRPVNGLEASKVQELLAYLVIHRNHIHMREALATLLWADSSAVQSRKFLRQVLWRLQTALNSSQTGLPASSILEVRSDTVRLLLPPGLWLDVAEFEQSVAAARGISGPELDRATAKQLVHAASLYQGDLLEGWYHDWCLFERERLQNMYLSVLDKLIDYCEVHEAFEEGLGYAALALRLDRSRETTHRRMMRLYYLSGDRTSALHQYQRCVVSLEDDLGVAPAKATVALYRQICADQMAPTLSEGTTPNSPVATPQASLIAALDQLAQVQSALSDVQRQVQADISAIELSLRSRQIAPRSF